VQVDSNLDAMKIVVFGLAISSSWGNGHATLWRGLCRALAARGHTVVFFERDVPYYSSHRDMWELPDGRLHLYTTWDDARLVARRELADADVGMTTSFCPDAGAAETLVFESRAAIRVFYDLDTPVTLDRLRRGEPVPYIGARGLADYDLVLSYTGGTSLDALRDQLGARVALPLYGSVDPAVHQPVSPTPLFRADLSHLGTYADDRQTALDELFVEPARRLPNRRFVLGGSQYPTNFPWTDNIYYMRHVAPDWHSAFYCSARLTLNVTRAAMAAAGYCPSGRLFEAAACGAPILSDDWQGLEQFFEPHREIVIAHSTTDAIEAIRMPDADLLAMGRHARERAVTEHTADCRARELEDILESRNGGGGVGDHSGRGSWHANSAARVF
jgi:spore maturation protein CgeB